MDLTPYYITFHDPLWIILLSTVLFFPVRKLIWVLYVRKKQKTQQSVSEEEKIGLKKIQKILKLETMMMPLLS